MALSIWGVVIASKLFFSTDKFTKPVRAALVGVKTPPQGTRTPLPLRPPRRVQGVPTEKHRPFFYLLTLLGKQQNLRG